MTPKLLSKMMEFPLSKLGLTVRDGAVACVLCGKTVNVLVSQLHLTL